MKKILLKTILIFITATTALIVKSQTSSWQWARSAGSTGSEAATGSVLDASGNLYVVGWYTSANITFGATTLTNPGSFTSDMFLVKYNSAGAVLWAKTFGSIDGEIGNSIAADAAGNVYVTGWFSGAIFAMDSYTLTNAAAGNNDVFIAKIDPAGTTVWAKSAGGSAGDRGMGIAVDPSGNVFTTGGFNSTSINFGTGNLANSSASANDIFLAKHDANGNALWAKNPVGTGSDIGYSVATDSLGNAYVTGSFASAAINFGTPVLFNAGSTTQDIFVVKYNGLGTALWSLRSGGTLDDVGNCIAVRKGGVYVTGGFSSASLAFGTSTLTNSSAGTYDALLAKFDLSGNPLWGKSAGGTDSEAGNGVAVDSLGTVYISGYYASGSINFGTTTLTNAMGGYRDLFLCGYDAAGNALWAASSAGGTYDEAANCISVNSTGNDIYIGGTFNSASVTFGSSTIYKGCGDDVMVAKMTGATVGIQEISLSKIINIYPNPTSGKFNVEAEGKIIFYNAVGEEVFSEKLTKGNQTETNEFDFSAYPKGIYFFRVYTDKKDISTGRVVVE